MKIFDSWGMGGLIKANLAVYFDSIKRDFSHYDALKKVLKTRYPHEPGKMEKVAYQWETEGIHTVQPDKNKSPTEKDELQYLLNTMYCVELSLDRDDVIKALDRDKIFEDKFNELYDKIRVKYL